jgi:DNA repair photolyase
VEGVGVHCSIECQYCYAPSLVDETGKQRR